MPGRPCRTFGTRWTRPRGSSRSSSPVSATSRSRAVSSRMGLRTSRLPTSPSCRTRAAGNRLRCAGLRLRATRGLGKDALQVEVKRSDESSRSFAERRGFEKVGGEEAVSLRLGAPQPACGPGRDPDRLAPRTPGCRRSDVRDLRRMRSGCARLQRPDDALRLACGRHRPAEPVARSRVHRVRRRRGRGGRGRRHLRGRGLSRVHGRKRAWRRRGLATALKRAQITAATDLGLKRLVTGSEERNLPMRALTRSRSRADPSARSFCAGSFRRKAPSAEGL